MTSRNATLESRQVVKEEDMMGETTVERMNIARPDRGADATSLETDVILLETDVI